MIFHFDKDFAGNWTKGQEVSCKELPNGTVLVDEVAAIDLSELCKNGHFVDKCSWCKNKGIDQNLMHNNCKASGYSRFEPIKEITIPSGSVITKDQQEKLQKLLQESSLQIVPLNLISLGDFVDIKIGYDCGSRSGSNMPAIVVMGVEPDGQIFVLKNIIPAEYGSFSIKELIEDSIRAKETGNYDNK